MSAKSKRITIKPKHPNPLFEGWLLEWRDSARQNGSKMENCFSNALKALRQYPLPLERGKDCKILKGFGEKLCQMLDEKLSQYRASNGDGSPLKKKANLATSASATSSTSKTLDNRKVNSSEKVALKEYVPQSGSGAYAILVTLYDQSQEFNYPGFLLKTEIIAKAKHLSNTSFTKPGPDTRYTAWSSMANLLQKKLIKKEGNPAKFSLTPEGSVLGEKLYIQQKVEEFQNLENENKSVNGPFEAQSNNLSTSIADNIRLQSSPKKTVLWRTISTNSTSSQASTVSNLPSVVLAPHTFDIVLLVDNRELSG